MNSYYFNITAVKKQSEPYNKLRLELSGLSVFFVRLLAVNEFLHVCQEFIPTSVLHDNDIETEPQQGNKSDYNYCCRKGTVSF